MGIVFGRIIAACIIHDHRMWVVGEVVDLHLSRISEYNFKQMNNQINLGTFSNRHNQILNPHLFIFMLLLFVPSILIIWI